MSENEDGTFVICEACRQPVDPGSTEVIRAAEVIDTPTFEGPGSIEGQHVFFHRAHYPGGRRYRLIAK